jgi:TRAP-type C4-dicarboxylate transport system substrate-binding protein
MDIVKRRVAEKYPGQLEIVFRGGPEAIPPSELIEAIRTGVVDIGFFTMGYIQGAVIEVAGQKLSKLNPMGEKNSGWVDFLNSIFEKKVNAVYLGRIGEDIGYHFYLKKAITSPDFKGLTLRVSPHHIAATKALGAKPVQIMGGEIYTALERGVIDGFVWPATGITERRWHEHIGYKVMPGWYNVDVEFVINRDRFYGLPKHLQELLRDATVERMKECPAWWKKQEQDEHSRLLAAGIKPLTFSPKDTEQFLKVIYDAGWEEFRGFVSPDVFEKATKLLKK